MTQQSQNKISWIKIGQISSPKGLDGRFLLVRSPLILPSILKKQAKAAIGPNPEVGIPALLTDLSISEDEAIEIKLNNISSPEDAQTFLKQAVWLQKSSLNLTNPQEVLIAELIGKIVVSKYGGQRIGEITQIEHYGASFVATIIQLQKEIDLPLIPEYFDYATVATEGVVTLLKPLEDIQDLWEESEP